MKFSRDSIAGAGLAAAIVACFVSAFWYPLAGLAGGSTLLVIGMAIPNAASSEFIRTLAAWGVVDPMGGLLLHVQAKTADYTILDPYTATGGDPSGTIFTNRGAAGTVNFTLPAPVARLAGVFYEFLGFADQSILVKTATADTLVMLNDATADSIAMSTAGAKIGGHLRVVCDGTNWYAYGDAVGITYTLAT